MMDLLNHGTDSLEKVPLCDCGQEDQESETFDSCGKRHRKLKSLFQRDKTGDSPGALFHGARPRRNSLQVFPLSGKHYENLYPGSLADHDKSQGVLKSLFHHHDKGRRRSYAFERVPLGETGQQHDRLKSLLNCDKEHGRLRAIFNRAKEQQVESESEGEEEPVEFEESFMDTSAEMDDDDKQEGQQLESAADGDKDVLEGSLMSSTSPHSGDDSGQEQDSLEKQTSTSDEEEEEDPDTPPPNSDETDDERSSSSEASEKEVEGSYSYPDPDNESDKIEEGPDAIEKREESPTPSAKEVDKSDTAKSLLYGVKAFYNRERSKRRHKAYDSNMELETHTKPKTPEIKKRLKREMPTVNVEEKVQKLTYNDDELEKQITALFDDVKIRYNLMEPPSTSKPNKKKSNLKNKNVQRKYKEYGQNYEKGDKQKDGDGNFLRHKHVGVSFEGQSYNRPPPLVQRYTGQTEHLKAILFNTFGGKQRGVPGLKSATSIIHVYNESVLVTDMLDSKVVLYDRSGRVRQTFMGKEHSEPWASVMTPDGHVLVTLRRDACFALWPKDASTVKMFGHAELKCPTGIAVDKLRRIIVTDEGAHDVFLFDDSGRFLFRLSDLKQTTFKQPRYVCVSASGRIIVSDSGNHCVKVFDMDGEFLFQLGSYGYGEGKLKFPYGVCVDHEEHIIVADHYNDRVVMFSSEGQFLQTLIAHRPGMRRPQGVSVRCAHDRKLYITHGEYRASEVIVFKLIPHKSELSVSVEQFA
ncbi:uncharacterized protein [Haliotis asinina]|uniref:uncharacterized protein n=1 Tax=Haliotis asinina TaxID=109174 RepID=UPI003531B10E